MKTKKCPECGKDLVRGKVALAPNSRIEYSIPAKSLDPKESVSVLELSDEEIKGLSDAHSPHQIRKKEAVAAMVCPVCRLVIFKMT